MGKFQQFILVHGGPTRKAAFWALRTMRGTDGEGEGENAGAGAGGGHQAIGLSF